MLNCVLNCIDPGDTVRNLYALGYNSTSVRIRWDPPSLPNGIISYRLYQWKANNTQKINNTTLALLYDGNHTSYDSKRLDKDQTYFYQVVPYNIKYNLDGPSSELINATTHEDSKYLLVHGEKYYIL